MNKQKPAKSINPQQQEVNTILGLEAVAPKSNQKLSEFEKESDHVKTLDEIWS